MNYVAPEALPADLLVQLNQSPVLHEAFIAGTNGNLRGIEDVSQDVLVLYAPGPRELAVELFHSPYRLPPSLICTQTPPARQLLWRPRPDGLPQALKLVLVAVDLYSLVLSLVHDGLECVLVGLAAEEDDLATSRTVILEGIELITMFALQENSMAGRKEEDPISFAAFTKVGTTGTFDVMAGFGSDSETEYRSEWAAYIGG